MKTIGFDLTGRGAGVVLLLVLVVLVPLSGLGQAGGQYDLSWNTIDGGGGRSSGGAYRLSCTIGQPDAAYSAGGRYELLGGFWPGFLECVRSTAPEYGDWVAWGKPACWCFARPCRGDADGIQTGPFWVAIPDLNLLRGAINKSEAVLATIPDGICCDFDHIKTGPFRVAIPDLNILRQYINKPLGQVPKCDEPPLYTGPYNFWRSP